MKRIRYQHYQRVIERTGQSALTLTISREVGQPAPSEADFAALLAHGLALQDHARMVSGHAPGDAAPRMARTTRVLADDLAEVCTIVAPDTLAELGAPFVQPGARHD